MTVSVPDTCSWIQVIETKALTTRTYNFTVEENETFVARSGVIVFHNETLGITEQVVVRQAAAVPQIIIGEGVYEFDAAGGDLSIDVTSNFGVTVSVPDTCSWIKVVETRAMTKRTFSFIVETNETFVEREGRILFQNESLGKKDVVVIRQKADTPVLIIGEHQYEFPPEGGDLIIELSSNMMLDIEIQPSCKWIEAVETRAVTERIHTFAVSKNHGRTDRSAWVVFRNDQQRFVDTVYVSQSFQPILIPCDTLKTSSRGSTMSFETVGVNPSDYRIACAHRWLSFTKQELYEGHSRFYVTSQPQSEGASSRDSEVWVYYKDYAEPDTVRIHQFERLPSFSYTTRARTVTVPSIEGENQWGYVYWGDESQEQYAPGLTHHYSSSGIHTVTIEIRSKKRVPIKELEDGMTVNLRELRK